MSHTGLVVLPSWMIAVVGERVQPAHGRMRYNLTRGKRDTSYFPVSSCSQ